MGKYDQSGAAGFWEYRIDLRRMPRGFRIGGILLLVCSIPVLALVTLQWTGIFGVHIPGVYVIAIGLCFGVLGILFLTALMIVSVTANPREGLPLEVPDSAYRYGGRGRAGMDPAQLRRIGRTALVSGVLIALILSAIPTIGSLRGEGFSWRSIGTFAAGTQAADAVASGHISRIRDAIGTDDALGELKTGDIFLGLADLEAEGVQVTEGKALLGETQEEDGFSTTVLRFIVKDGVVEYQLDFLATASGGKAYMIRLEDIRFAGETEPLMESWYPEWLGEFEELLCTYNPG